MGRPMASLRGLDRRLLRLYPKGWRQRYGEELLDLLESSPPSARLGLIPAAFKERLHASGLLGPDRRQTGVFWALWGWLLFVVGGMAVQKASEHWQASVPASSRALPDASFQALVLAALASLVLVVGALCWTLPALAPFLRGHLALVRRRLGEALILTGATGAALAAIVPWAHSLSPTQRNGHDPLYGLVLLGFALLLVAALAAWTALGVAVVRRLELPDWLWRLLALHAAGVAGAMVVMIAATALWWSAVSGWADTPALATALAFMLGGAALGLAGARRALTA